MKNEEGMERNDVNEMKRKALPTSWHCFACFAFCKGQDHDPAHPFYVIKKGVKGSCGHGEGGGKQDNRVLKLRRG
jgi:hypothetical protein